jgi:hypothetical protein
VNIWLILAGAAFVVWLFHGGLETIERAKVAGEYVRSWSSAIIGAAIAVFVIIDVMPGLGHG